MKTYIKPKVIGRIGRTKKQRPKYEVPGLDHVFVWTGDAPASGTEMAVEDFLAWIDERGICLKCRHLLDQASHAAQPTVRESALRRTTELRQRKREIAQRNPDRFPADCEITDKMLTEEELLEVYGPPTAKQRAYIKGLGYAGAMPRTTKDAAQLISDLLARRDI